MILSDATIRKSIETGKIRIFPDFDDKDIRPAGVRLHLGDELLVPIPGQTVDLSGTHDLNYEKVIISNTRGGVCSSPWRICSRDNLRDDPCTNGHRRKA